MKLSQEFLLSSILYLFYNVSLIETCTNENIIVSRFINDVIMLIVKDIAKENLEILYRDHDRVAYWVNTHESIFIRMIVELSKTHIEQPNHPIGGVGHPILFNELSRIDRSVRRSNPTHSRGAQTLFEKKVKKFNLLIWWFYDQKIKKFFFLKETF
jgi:hypothetical protein